MAKPQRSRWLRHFFYRKETWKTTWKLRLTLLLIITVVPYVTRGFWTVRVARGLVCAEQTPSSDALLVENFDPDYLVFEHAETLRRAGVATRIVVPTSDPMNRAIAELMARVAWIPEFKFIPIQAVEPISLNAAKQVRDALLRDNVKSVVVVSPAFRSRRSELVYSSVFTPAGIRVSCAPVYSLRTPDTWTHTWHGIQEVLEQFTKLQYYRFWVLL